jgi:putative DNA primase/helicase
MTGETSPPTFIRSDAGNAERLVATHGQDLRYVPGVGWHYWDGCRWRRDDDGELTRRVRDVARRMLRDATDEPDDAERKRAVAFALRSEGVQRLAAAVTLAAADQRVVVRGDLLDAHPMLLTCANGTIDLQTGRLLDAQRDHLITRATPVPYDPDAKCPRWERFLLEVFAGDDELIAFVHRLAGYCLTGDTREHALIVLHGAGANGKSTLVETLRRLLGELATAASFDAFTRARGDRGPRNDLARLRGARLVTASESGEGRRLDEATVKEVTGGDTLAVRFLYGEHFEFQPDFKLWLVSNHRPRVDGDDDAIWRRLRLIPFNVSFEGREDRTLTNALEHELPGILAWAVRGCLDWQHRGLQPPATVLAATIAYRDDEDTLGAFLAECTTPGGQTRAADLRGLYETWCTANGETPIPGNELGKRLAKRGIEQKRGTKGARHYIGIRVTGDSTTSKNGNSPSTPARRGLSESAVTSRHPSPNECPRAEVSR